MAVVLRVLPGEGLPLEEGGMDRVCELRRLCPERAWIEVAAPDGGRVWGCPEHAAVMVAKGRGQVVDVDLDRLRPSIVEDVQSLLAEAGDEAVSQLVPGSGTFDPQGNHPETVSASAPGELPAVVPVDVLDATPECERVCSLAPAGVACEGPVTIEIEHAGERAWGCPRHAVGALRAEAGARIVTRVPVEVDGDVCPDCDGCGVVFYDEAEIAASVAENGVAYITAGPQVCGFCFEPDFGPVPAELAARLARAQLEAAGLRPVLERLVGVFTDAEAIAAVACPAEGGLEADQRYDRILIESGAHALAVELGRLDAVIGSFCGSDLTDATAVGPSRVQSCEVVGPWGDER